MPAKKKTAVKGASAKKPETLPDPNKDKRNFRECPGCQMWVHVRRNPCECGHEWERTTPTASAKVKSLRQLRLAEQLLEDPGYEAVIEQIDGQGLIGEFIKESKGAENAKAVLEMMQEEANAS